MDSKTNKRKPRSDRTHYIYQLVIRGQRYIGVTAKTASTARKSIWARVNKHWYRAHTEHKNWLLCAALRDCADRSEITVEILAVVRGKAAAHREEVRLRRATGPELNTDVR
jgi:hypothetical protein